MTNETKGVIPLLLTQVYYNIIKTNFKFSFSSKNYIGQNIKIYY